MEIQLQRLDDDYHFRGSGMSPVEIHIDAAEAVGGHNAGARPMELILMGLGSCSAIDVISILKKQRQDVRDVRITVEGRRRDEPLPNVFTDIQLTFHLSGPIDIVKAQKAVNLSMDKYCSVTAMLEPSVNIHCEVLVTP